MHFCKLAESPSMQVIGIRSVDSAMVMISLSSSEIRCQSGSKPHALIPQRIEGRSGTQAT
jgi:hypothetical protein